MAYKGSVYLPSGIKQFNDQDFPLVDSSAVRVTDNQRLDAKLTELGNASSASTINNLIDAKISGVAYILDE